MAAETTKYTTGRIPVIALDYESRFAAEKRELLVDYKKGKLYVVSADDKSVIFDITSQVINEFKNESNISNFTVEIEGVGTYELGNIIKILMDSRIEMVEREKFTYNSPIIRCDNQSIAIYDQEASLLGFKGASENTYPVKVDGRIQWLPSVGEEIFNRVDRLEAIAPPDNNEFSQFRERLSKVELTADLYKELPTIKDSVTTVNYKIENLENHFLELNKISVMNERLNTMDSSLNNMQTDVDKLKDNNYDTQIQTLTNSVVTLGTKTDAQEVAIESVTNSVKSLNDLNLDNRIRENAANITSLTQTVENNTNGITDVSQTIITVRDQAEAKIASNKTAIDSVRADVDDNINKTSEALVKISALENSIGGISGGITESAVRAIVTNMNDTEIKPSINTLTNQVSGMSSKVNKATSDVADAKTKAQEAIDSLTTHKTRSELDHADKSVTSIKIADAAIVARTIANEEVKANHLAEDSVTTVKIKNKSVNVSKLNDALSASIKNNTFGLSQMVTFDKDSLDTPHTVTLNDSSTLVIDYISTVSGLVTGANASGAFIDIKTDIFKFQSDTATNFNINSNDDENKCGIIKIYYITSSTNKIVPPSIDVAIITSSGKPSIIKLELNQGIYNIIYTKDKAVLLKN